MYNIISFNSKCIQKVVVSKSTVNEYVLLKITRKVLHNNVLCFIYFVVAYSINLRAHKRDTVDVRCMLTTISSMPLTNMTNTPISQSNFFIN
jgi:hypothetical protein